jgi:paraquat-inducible protein B
MFFPLFYFKLLSLKVAGLNKDHLAITNRAPATVPETSNLLLPLKDGQVVTEQAAKPEAVAVPSSEVSEEELEDQRLLAEFEKEMADNQVQLEMMEAEINQLGRFIEEGEKELQKDMAENQKELQDLETLQARQALIQDILSQKTTLETAVEKTMKVGSKVMSGLSEIASDLSPTLTSNTFKTPSFL